jgi:hypothetical protein
LKNSWICTDVDERADGTLREVMTTSSTRSGADTPSKQSLAYKRLKESLI